MPFFIDVFHGFYRTPIVPTFIDIVPFLINFVPTNNLFLLEIFESLICVFKSEMFRRIPREQVSTVQWASVSQKMSLLPLILQQSPSAP